MIHFGGVLLLLPRGGHTFGLPRKQKIGMKKVGFKNVNWREMPMILGVNLGVNPKPWRNKAEK